MELTTPRTILTTTSQRPTPWSGCGVDRSPPGQGAVDDCYSRRSPGQVAEWQTRTVQVRVSERTWGFNSPLAHSSLGAFPQRIHGRCRCTPSARDENSTLSVRHRALTLGEAAAPRAASSGGLGQL